MKTLISKFNIVVSRQTNILLIIPSTLLAFFTLSRTFLNAEGVPESVTPGSFSWLTGVIKVPFKW